jgi:hypothetical protein
MTTRTFKQQGQAFGGTPVSITASIGGVQVFSGQIATLDQPVPALPDPAYETWADLFTWTNTVDFAGTSAMSITVTGGTLLLTDTLANYCRGQTDIYASFYSDTSQGFTCFDPLSGITINGVAQTAGHSAQLSGQWYWTIPAGATFDATVNIQSGIEATPWNQSLAYAQYSLVSYNNIIYVAIQNVPNGTDISNKAYWSSGPS